MKLIDKGNLAFPQMSRSYQEAVKTRASSEAETIAVAMNPDGQLFSEPQEIHLTPVMVQTAGHHLHMDFAVIAGSEVVMMAQGRSQGLPDFKDLGGLPRTLPAIIATAMHDNQFNTPIGPVKFVVDPACDSLA